MHKSTSIHASEAYSIPSVGPYELEVKWPGEDWTSSVYTTLHEALVARTTLRACSTFDNSPQVVLTDANGNKVG